MKYLYSIILIGLAACLAACGGDDDNDFSIKPAIGFAATSGSVVETNETGTRVGFYSNVTITEPVTVKVEVVNLSGLVYDVDYTTDPAPVDGIITVTIDPETELPAFYVMPKTTADDVVRTISFQIVEVTGNKLNLGQAATLTHTLRITKTEEGTPGTETIASIRARFTGATVSIPETIFIEGTIISSNDNVTARSAYIQDGTGGICLRFADPNTLLRGDRVRVALSGTTLSVFSGLLQVNLANNAAQKVGTAALPAPRDITVQQLIDKTYESQLVRISGVSFAAANGSLTVVGNTTFSNGTQQAIMRVETYSPFQGKILPSGTVALVGVASVFNTAQLIPQVASDIP